MVKGSHFLKRQSPCIDRDTGRICVDNETIIDIWLLLTQGKGVIWGDARVLFDWPCRNAAIVDYLVFVRDQGDLCTSDGGCVAKNEVAASICENRLPFI